MTVGVKAMSYDGGWTSPDWPVLTLEEIDTLLRSFPLAGRAKSLSFQSPRPFSSACLAETEQGTVFVKRHHCSLRDYEGLSEEHRFLKHLHTKGARVTELLADENGETVIVRGDWTYEVHAQAQGLDLYREAQSWTPYRSCHHAYSAGRALAELHNAAEGFQALPRRARSLVTSFTIFAGQDPLPALECYLAARPVLQQYLEQRNWREATETILLPFYGNLKLWLPFLSPLWTHNDLHGSNLLWTDASDQADVTCVIDFGLADRTNAAHDIATAIERSGICWLALDEEFEKVVFLDQISALLRGYEEARPLTFEDAHAIAALPPLVHAEFALSEVDYFLTQLKAPEKAPFAWDNYFIAHAQWFRTAHGQRLLEFLARWAETPRPHRNVAEAIAVGVEG